MPAWYPPAPRTISRRVTLRRVHLYWADDSAQAKRGRAGDAVLVVKRRRSAPREVLPGVRDATGTTLFGLFDGASRWCQVLPRVWATGRSRRPGADAADRAALVHAPPSGREDPDLACRPRRGAQARHRP